MIKRIEQINNLGRFENFSATGEFGNNTIIFGFNGAGKSDIFYSLSKDNTDGYLVLLIKTLTEYISVCFNIITISC